tara:strand:- start:1663 stop:2160 length:498 start_codon:yes stop_codon:yes gene_type:complete
MNNALKNIVLAISFILLQCLVLNDINLINGINPLLYIYLIIYFPIINNRFAFILLSFIYGLTIDLLCDTAGIHAAACVSLAYFRPIFLKLFFGMTYVHQVVKFKKINIKQNILYVSSLTLFHHYILFFIEVFDSSKLILVFEKTFFTSIFTILLVLLLNLFLKKK